MKKKFFTLLTLLVAVCTGAWADEISCSAALSATAGSPTVSNCSLAFYSDEEQVGTVPGGTVRGDYYYAKMNNDKNYYEITLSQGSYTKFQAGDIIDVYLYTYSASPGYKVGKTARTVVSASKQTKDKVYKYSHTLTADEIESDGTLRIYRNSSNTYFAKITVSGTRSSETYTVTFDAGSNGSCDTSSLTEESAGAGVTLPSVTANINYTFNGWYTSATEGTKVGDAGDTYTPTSNVTLYAQYSANEAPTIAIGNYNPSTTRGTVVTFTTTLTGSPAPTVTWYQSATATTTGGTEKGTGVTYSPDVNTEGTFYYYAIASNGISPDATSSLITLTVTNPDRTINGNNFYVAVNDLPIPEQNIFCDDITMQYSKGSYSAATGDATTTSLVSDFVATINCSTNGWGVTFTPSKIGILKVGVVINKDKTFSITNATAFSYQAKNPDGSGNIESNTWTPSEKKYAVITLAVQADSIYKFSVSGSKMGFYGFEFTPASTTAINLNASGFATYSTYCDVEATGAIAYTAALDYANETITCAEIEGNVVPAGNGVLLFGEPNAEVTLTPTTGGATLENNDLKATTLASGITVAKGSNDYYVLSGNAFKTYTRSSFAANKAYFEVESGVVQARNFRIVFDETTGINGVRTIGSDLNDELFDLQGRRIAQPTKGLYIKNGKKIVIK